MPDVQLTPEEQAAWDLYCEERAGSADFRDFWHELPAGAQVWYLAKVRDGERCSYSRNGEAK